MKCSKYFDAVLVDSPLPCYQRLGVLMRRMHQTGVAKNVRFAVDFPMWMKTGTPGAKVRVFFESDAGAESFKSGLETAVDDDEVMTGSIKTVSEALIKGWVNVIRVREPNKVKPTDNPERDAQNNERYMTRLNASKRHPSLPILSSSGDLMRLLIERVTADESVGEPNSYGLSRQIGRVRVPVF